MGNDSQLGADRRCLTAEMEAMKQGRDRFRTMEEAEARLEALNRKHGSHS